jgi:hypothetical protein
LKQYVDRTSHLESLIDNLRQQQAQQSSVQEELVAMRLETIERELLSCLRPKDLDSIRHDVGEIQKGLQRELSEQVRALGLELQGKLQGQADSLQKDLKDVNAAINAKLEMLDQQLDAMVQVGGSGGHAEAGTVVQGVHELDVERRIEKASSKLSQEITSLDARVKELEGLCEGLKNLSSGEDGQQQQRRLSNQSLMVDGQQLFAGMGGASMQSSPPGTGVGSEVSPELPRLVPPGQSRSGSKGTSPSPSHATGWAIAPLQEQENSEFVSRVDNALDSMARRLEGFEKELGRVTATHSPHSTGAFPTVSASEVPELAQFQNVAAQVDKSLSDMSSRIAMLEEGHTAPVENQAPPPPLPPSLPPKAALDEEDSEDGEMKAVASPSPSSVLEEFRARTEAALAGVSQRIGQLETTAIGAPLKELDEFREHTNSALNDVSEKNRTVREEGRLY